MAAVGGGGRGKSGGKKGEESLAYRAWRQYLLQLQQHPLRTKMITAGCLAGISDSVAQKLSGFQKIEKRRLLLKMLFGFAYGGPFGHFWHKVLDYIFKGKKDNKTIAKKVLLEQLTSSPLNNILFLSYYGYVVERRPLNEVKNRVKKQYPSVQLSAWMGNISQPSRKDYVFEAGIDNQVCKVGHVVVLLSVVVTGIH
ncbi:hypothetical protein EJB05_24921, partial [Eragrostis curvula]